MDHVVLHISSEKSNKKGGRMSWTAKSIVTFVSWIDG